LSKRLLKPVHEGLGPDLKMLFVGGAFVDRERAQRFYDLGIPLAIGYGLTEACTVLTVNDGKPFRSDSVGRPLDGVELEVRGADERGVGEVWVKSRTVFAGYLNDPEQTAEVLVDGWLKTGDLGFLDPSGHLHLVGRSKNMIVTAGGKNVYPEDVESAFEAVECEELVVFATGFVWPGTKLTEEGLVAVVRAKKGKRVEDVLPEIRRQNLKLADYKRLSAVLPWEPEMPRTASMKVKRATLAEEIRAAVTPSALVTLELA
jgi:long-chain acyl-CoA synthetase